MFDWFRTRRDYIMPEVPDVKPPEKPTHTYYRLGLTDNNRVSFQMGHNELTMNVGGINGMIKLLEAFRDQLKEESVEEE